ncbi:hypothetical protein TRAPUB_1334 [Trametes pubescens]|uniref:Transcription factor domain-containing protein n=1 Tax=Trametes pubescens TaxID=154538 RepID=A0A1M2VJL2_TRAPU|nr:hypothetical protein TRAPUB_1334 [Trametes pubescens]
MHTQRCDGNKPACGRCLANGRPDDCEYAVGGEVTRSRLLEENVALLEARIRELENPNETTPSVRLHDPRRQDAPAAGSSRGAAPIAPNTQILVPGIPQLASPGSYAAPAQQEAQTLVQTFMAHASQLGLFMNPTRFMRAASLPRGAPGCLDDALMNAVYLWGSRLSSSNTLRGRETYFSANAVQAAAAGCALTPQPNGPVSNNVLYSAQTSVLLANYFLSAGRFLEGKYHWLAAVALVTGSKLHQLDIVALVGARMDPISIGERVHAFWTVFALDKAWSAAMNGPPSICQRGRAGILVTTPWPLATEAYEQGTILPSRGYNYSIHDFVRGAPIDESADDFSRLAIHAKAAALYESALYVSSQYRHDMPNRSEFLAQFTALDTHIEGFHRLLAGIRNRGPDDTRELLTSRTLVCVAAIQLHSAFAAQQSTSRQKSLGVAIAAARALDLVDLNQYRHLDSVVAMLWGTVSRALLEEIRRLIQSAAPVRQEDVARITTSLDRVMGAMSSLAYNSPLMATQLSEIQQARASLN